MRFWRLFSVLCYGNNMFVLIFFSCVFSLHRMFVMQNIYFIIFKKHYTYIAVYWKRDPMHFIRVCREQKKYEIKIRYFFVLSSYFYISYFLSFVSKQYFCVFLKVRSVDLIQLYASYFKKYASYFLHTIHKIRKLSYFFNPCCIWINYDRI